MREDVSSGKLLLMPRNTEKKEKKKKKKKKKKKRKQTAARGNSSTPHTSQEKPQTTALLHETSPVSILPPPCPGQLRGQLPKVRACSRKDGEKDLGGGRRSKKQPKDSTVLSTGTNKSSSSGAPSQGDVAELSAQARESLRWEGVLEDPQAEEKRLELYRANRRQRYLTHRQETQAASRQTFPREDTEEKILPNSDQ